MHKDFPYWCRTVSIQPSADFLEKRSAAVEKIAKWQRRSVVLDLVRIVSGTATSESETGAAVGEAARSVDSTYSSHDSAAEVRVLAGAALVEMLQRPSDVADVAALGIVSASFLRPGDELARAFQTCANSYLSGEAVRVRESPGKVSVDVKAPMDVFQAAGAAAGAVPQLVDPILTLVSSVANLVASTVRDSVAAEMAALREESNMFWWAFTARSKDLGRPFRGTGSWVSLVAAKELADLTEMMPGPRAAPALLEHVVYGTLGAAVDPVSLSSVINGAPRTWRETLKKEYPPSDTRELTPVLVGVERALQTDSESDWISAFEKATGVRDGGIAPSVLATQAYLECLFIRAASELAAK